MKSDIVERIDEKIEDRIDDLIGNLTGMFADPTSKKYRASVRHIATLRASMHPQCDCEKKKV